MKTRKSTRSPARKNSETATKRNAKRSAKAGPPGATAKRAAKKAAGTAKRAAKKAAGGPAATVKRAAKKAVARVKRVARGAAPKARKAVRKARERAFPEQSSREHVHALLEDFTTVMLVTAEGSGRATKLRARPMNVAALADDCTLTFVTSIDTAKVDEAQGSAVQVVAQGRTVFVSMSGRAEVVRDRDRIEAAWKPADQVYFPKGKDDPSLCLILFHPEEAELWDVSGVKGLRYLFDAAKALLSGEKPARRGDAETHDVVDLRADA